MATILQVEEGDQQPFLPIHNRNFVAHIKRKNLDLVAPKKPVYTVYI